MSQPKDHWKFEIVGKSISISCACDPEPTVIRINSLKHIRWSQVVGGVALIIDYGRNSSYRWIYGTEGDAREICRELLMKLAHHGYDQSVRITELLCDKSCVFAKIGP